MEFAEFDLIFWATHRLDNHYM